MRFDFTKINKNVTRVLTLYNTGYDILFFFHESIVNKSSFSFPNALCYNLFSCLSSNTSEITRRYFNFGYIIQLEISVNLASGRQ
ncbi:hypothetical protein D3C71_2118340 [compost metagenome]